MMRGDMVGSDGMVRRVVHLGPSESKGGMATIIHSLSSNPPKGWEAEAIPTRGKGVLSIIPKWLSVRRDLNKRIINKDVDIVHIHVTHSLSWWRKRSFMRLCERRGVPTIVHIHSGKFDGFCSGIGGTSVRNELVVENRKTIVLENRWKMILSDWIPEDAEVVNNVSEPMVSRRDHKLDGNISLLVLSRKSAIKGHDFAVRILEELVDRGFEATLTITGIQSIESKNEYSKLVMTPGWVSEDQKARLVGKADFLLSPSKFEGSSMSVIESMVCGLPCIVSSASRETVGSETFVVESEEPSDWADLIINLYEKDEYAKAVEEISSKSEKYNIENSRIRLGEIYEQLLAKLQ